MVAMLAAVAALLSIGANAKPGDDVLLALSWQPAFCETQPGKQECRTQTADRFDALNLALHGLWPQPRGNEYCGVSPQLKNLDKQKQWDDLPPLVLSNQTRTELARVMPGTQSMLDRHEWIKHGTCYGADAEIYYRKSIDLVDQASKLKFSNLLRNNVGKQIQLNDLCSALREDFGPNFAQAIAINTRSSAQGRNAPRILSEIWINMKDKGALNYTLDASGLSNNGGNQACRKPSNAKLLIDAAG
ncbi:MAG TPA: ribonuclease T [Alphaproteobacteria bacterium]|nr:ribonuclease T [Alphaproteobacteria bacterium]